MKMKTAIKNVLIKGAGEIATGIAYALHKAGYKVALTEIEKPLAVSRATCFSEAIFDGAKTIQGVTAELVPATLQDIDKTWRKGNIPVMIDPLTEIRELLKPDVLIDARMLKKVSDTKISDAPLVIGIGPGFIAGLHVHIIIESNDIKGNLGKIIYEGESENNTGLPIKVGGLASERVVWAPREGVFNTTMRIGDPVTAGQIVGDIGGVILKAPLTGYLRGLLRDGVAVTKGTKMIEVDHINPPGTFNMIREKMRVIGEAVVQAVRS
jgi:xanthine dehydrogenase accessory factor